jgi:hypothetical protein
MTRLVVAFFLCITFLLTVTWIIPGAKLPEMTAATPAAVPKSVTVPRVAIIDPAPQQPEAPRPAPAEARPVPAAPASTQAPRAAQASACDTDPIRCMLEGKAVAADPAEVTGSVVAPRKAAAKPVAAHPALSHPAKP